MNNTFSHALTLHNACRLEEAEILYKKILEIDQNHFDALHMLGVLLTDQDAIQAIALLSRAVENKPHEPMPLSNLANALLKIEQYPLALGLCDHCLLIEPKFWRAHANRAVALMGMGQHADAIIGLTQAIEIEPGVSALWSNRGNAYEAIDQFESALNDHNQAIQLNPHFVDAYNNRGHLLIGLKINY